MKQIIVIRRDLNMRLGKTVAQGAHASIGAILPYTELGHPVDRVDTPDQRVIEWLRGSFTKVCVRVESLDELLDVYNKAKQADLIACLITDSGRTEFNGVPTVTCCAIGPDTPEKLDPITGHLKLL